MCPSFLFASSSQYHGSNAEPLHVRGRSAQSPFDGPCWWSPSCLLAPYYLLASRSVRFSPGLDMTKTVGEICYDLAWLAQESCCDVPAHLSRSPRDSVTARGFAAVGRSAVIPASAVLLLLLWVVTVLTADRLILWRSVVLLRGLHCWISMSMARCCGCEYSYYSCQSVLQDGSVNLVISSSP